MVSQLDADDAELEAIIDALRADDGNLLRAILKKLSKDDRPDSDALAEVLMAHPDLRDFIAH